MAFEMKEHDQTIRVFNLRADTQEFIGAGDAYIPAWTGLPANSTEIPPGDIPSGQVAVFDNATAAWSFAEDHRGATVYDTVTGAARIITSLGALPGNTVTVAPSGNYQKWDGTQWVEDEAAKKSALIAEARVKKDTLLAAAASAIAPLQDAVDLDMATEDETTLLAAWRKYRVLLSRIDASTAPDIVWPVAPAAEVQ